MKVTDLYGYQIKVTDLNKALEMAEFFKDCHHTPPQPIDKERQEYWTDMYEKLLARKTQRDKRNEQSGR